MSIDELVEKFPLHERFVGLDLKETLKTAFLECRFYQEVSQKIRRKLGELWPYPKTSFHSIEHQDYCKYFYSRDEFSFYAWNEMVLSEFILMRDWKRSYKDACHIAADKWCDMIFKCVMQNNGDESADGHVLSALATLGKASACQGISKRVVKRFNRLMAKYYIGGCLRTCKYGTYVDLPDCDYHPNRPLREMLLAAGVNEKQVELICPWKTTIYIDDRDNSVVVQGYQCESYL